MLVKESSGLEFKGAYKLVDIRYKQVCACRKIIYFNGTMRVCAGWVVIQDSGISYTFVIGNWVWIISLMNEQNYWWTHTNIYCKQNYTRTALNPKRYTRQHMGIFVICFFYDRTIAQRFMNFSNMPMTLILLFLSSHQGTIVQTYFNLTCMSLYIVYFWPRESNGCNISKYISSLS